MSRRVLFPLLLSLSLGVACQKQENTALTTPSSGEGAYATRYPDELARVKNRFAEREGQARRTLGTFASYPDELDKPSWPDVVAVYKAADAAGHGDEYVTRLHETTTVQSFFTEEKDELNKKVGGAAQYTAKQKGCTAELYGPTAAALDKTVEKQLEKRLRERNEAHHYIDDHEDALGKPNREKLEKQADDISLTSYLVKVGGAEAKRELSELVARADEVKKTLDRTIEEAKQKAADAKASEGDKKKATARAEAAEKAKARVDSEASEAQKLLDEIDKRNQTLADEYEKAFDALVKKAEGKGGSA